MAFASIDLADLLDLLSILLPVDPVWDRGRVMSRMEAEAGIEPANGSFADFCLTTWRLRRERMGGEDCAGGVGCQWVGVGKWGGVVGCGELGWEALVGGGRKGTIAG